MSVYLNVWLPATLSGFQSSCLGKELAAAAGRGVRIGYYDIETTLSICELDHIAPLSVHIIDVIYVSSYTVTSYRSSIMSLRFVII
ncbi:hypothetical protein DSUL_20361 [Desulfovibrionales bacterium]